MDSPNFTPVPNAILDALPLFGEAELAIVLAICRHTLGLGQARSLMSLGDIQAATGLTRAAVAIATRHLLADKWIERREELNSMHSYSYSLRLDGEQPVFPPRTRRKRFVQPTMQEAIDHGKTIGLPELECVKFWGHYDSKGWKVGDQPMQVWKSAIVTWRANWSERNGGTLAGKVTHAIIRQSRNTGTANATYELPGLYNPPR